MFLAFSLANVLLATTACTFSTSQLPKVVRGWCVLYFSLGNVLGATTACNFSSHLASWLRARRFSEPTFRPSGASNHWKNTVFRDFPTFSRICIFFLLTLFSSLIFSLLIFLFSLPLPCSAFLLSILSEVWLLNFLRQFIFETLGIVTHYISIHLVGRSSSSLSDVHNGLCLWCVQLRKIETHSKGKQHKQHVHIIWSPPFGIPAVPLPGRAIVEAALDGLPETSRWRVTHWRHERLRREKHARWFYSNFNLDEAFKN